MARFSSCYSASFVSRCREIEHRLGNSRVWLLKNLLLMMFSSSFHRNNFFDRVQESFFHRYIIETLSGPPFIELAEETMANSSVRIAEKGKGDETREINIGKAP
ncbi:hypothetical protein V6N13_062238 [Hibiscus sabdariffa]|uniref:Uncharacterized protein n=2 Tax=Hibiscus sabdariffa TaxID=183260 RepID=A0ABR2BQA1_9ROSI